MAFEDAVCIRAIGRNAVSTRRADAIGGPPLVAPRGGLPHRRHRRARRLVGRISSTTRPAGASSPAPRSDEQIADLKIFSDRIGYCMHTCANDHRGTCVHKSFGYAHMCKIEPFMHVCANVCRPDAHVCIINVQAGARTVRIRDAGSQGCLCPAVDNCAGVGIARALRTCALSDFLLPSLSCLLRDERLSACAHVRVRDLADNRPLFVEPRRKLARSTSIATWFLVENTRLLNPAPFPRGLGHPQDLRGANASLTEVRGPCRPRYPVECRRVVRAFRGRDRGRSASGGRPRPRRGQDRPDARGG